MPKNNNNGDEQFVLKKVPLMELVNTLIDIYNEGFDFVDIIGILGEEQDQIGITFSPNYKSNEFEEKDGDVPTSIKLSDEDLNQLT